MPNTEINRINWININDYEEKRIQLNRLSKNVPWQFRRHLEEHFKGWEVFWGWDHFEGMSFETTRIHFYLDDVFACRGHDLVFLHTWLS